MKALNLVACFLIGAVIMCGVALFLGAATVLANFYPYLFVGIIAVPGCTLLGYLILDF